ncbi:MAG: type II toxin-antitoxin system RelE/ParE family toxin [Planctomycetales bacterium]
MARVIWSPQAANDLEAICGYVARDSDTYARLVAERVMEAVDQIARFPESGSIVPEFEDPAIRECFVHRWRVIHRVRKESEIEIVTIFHASRLLRRLPGSP